MSDVLGDVAVAMAKLREMDKRYAKARAAYFQVTEERIELRKQVRKIVCDATEVEWVSVVAEVAGVTERTLYKWLSARRNGSAGGA